MNSNGNGLSRENPAAVPSNPRVIEENLEIETFQAHFALRFDKDGSPEQFSIVMKGDGLQFSPYTNMLSQLISLLLRQTPVQDMYAHFAPLRSLERTVVPRGVDSTQDAIFNEAICWLARKCIPDFSKSLRTSADTAQEQLALKM